MKIIEIIVESLEKDGFWKTCIGIMSVIFITLIAIPFYLVDHISNFLTGQGWTGMNLW